MIWYYNHISQGSVNLLIQMIMHVVNSVVFVIVIAIKQNSSRSSAIRLNVGLEIASVFTHSITFISTVSAKCVHILYFNPNVKVWYAS